MKIFINRRMISGPWGGGNVFVNALFRYAPLFDCDVTNVLTADVDIIHLQDHHRDSLGIDADTALSFCKSHPHCKLVHRVNDMDLGRYGVAPWRVDAYCKYSSNLALAIFVSDWTKEFYLAQPNWSCANNIVVVNGVDAEIFKPADKINNGKINIVTHHWSPNSGKGSSIYKQLDDFVSENDQFSFTYIGNTQDKFKTAKIISPLRGKELGETLAKYDVYISASEYENCPNHILESLSCKIPTYACANGGASVDIVGKEFVFTDWEHLKSILLEQQYNAPTYVPTDLKSMIKNYCNAYRKKVLC
jgi:glycosyltransferase involved in cell wall biosynthesis